MNDDVVKRAVGLFLQVKVDALLPDLNAFVRIPDEKQVDMKALDLGFGVETEFVIETLIVFAKLVCLFVKLLTYFVEREAE